MSKKYSDEEIEETLKPKKKKLRQSFLDELYGEFEAIPIFATIIVFTLGLTLGYCVARKE